MKLSCSYNGGYCFRSEVFSMDNYQEPGISDNHCEQVPVLQEAQQSQSMMTYEAVPPHVSPSLHEEINVQEHQSPQMPVHDAMSNLNLENQMPSTSGGIVDSPSGRVTRARTRGCFKLYNNNLLLNINVDMIFIIFAV